MIYVILLIIVVYALFIVPQARRRKRTQALQRQVEVGARIMTTSGLYGTVRAVEDDALRVEIADGVVVRLTKAAVLRTIPEPVAEPASMADTDLDHEFDADLGHDLDLDHDLDRSVNHEADATQPVSHDAGQDVSPDALDSLHDVLDGHDPGAGPVSGR